MSALIALAAGGTGGHLFPAEALAQELKRRGNRVLLVTDARGARFAADFPCDERFEISAATPNVGGIGAKIFAAFSMAGGLITALSQFKQRKPAAAVGFGGYPSLPAMKAAELMKIPYGVHEQNGVLGRSNRMLVKGSSFTAHAFSILDKAPAGADPKLKEVGNPVRDAVKALSAAPYQAPGQDAPINILIFGGSQGASLFSKAPPKALASLDSAVRARLNVVHQAREAEAASVEAIYQEAGIAHEVAPFFKDLPTRMANAHIIIGRSGASTVTELSTIGRPSILVPLAIAMDDHQTGNARVLAEAGGAEILSEKEFTETALKNALSPLLLDPSRPEDSRLASMAKAAQGCVRAGAAAALADLVEEIAV